jgi:hypothetical protein
MARGAQKIQAQQKNAAKQQKDKGSQKEAQAAGLKLTCQVCFTPMTNYKCLVSHYDAKHPKVKCPTEEELKA